LCACFRTLSHFCVDNNLFHPFLLQGDVGAGAAAADNVEAQDSVQQHRYEKKLAVIGNGGGGSSDSQSTHYAPPPSAQPSQFSLAEKASAMRERVKKTFSSASVSTRSSNSEYGNVFSGALPPPVLLPPPPAAFNMASNVEYSSLPVMVGANQQVVASNNYNQIPPARIDTTGYTTVPAPGHADHHYSAVRMPGANNFDRVLTTRLAVPMQLANVDLDASSSSTDEKIIERKRPMTPGAGRSQYEAATSHLTLSPLNADPDGRK